MLPLLLPLLASSSCIFRLNRTWLHMQCSLAQLVALECLLASIPQDFQLSSAIFMRIRISNQLSPGYHWDRPLMDTWWCTGPLKAWMSVNWSRSMPSLSSSSLLNCLSPWYSLTMVWSILNEWLSQLFSQTVLVMFICEYLDYLPSLIILDYIKLSSLYIYLVCLTLRLLCIMRYHNECGLILWL